MTTQSPTRRAAQVPENASPTERTRDSPREGETAALAFAVLELLLQPTENGRTNAAERTREPL